MGPIAVELTFPLTGIGWGVQPLRPGVGSGFDEAGE